MLCFSMGLREASILRSDIPLCLKDQLSAERSILKSFFVVVGLFCIFKSRKAKKHSSPKDAGGVSQVDRTPSSSEDIGVGNTQSWTHLTYVLVLPVAGVTFLEGFLCNLLSLSIKQHA